MKFYIIEDEERQIDQWVDRTAATPVDVELSTRLYGLVGKKRREVGAYPRKKGNIADVEARDRIALDIGSRERCPTTLVEQPGQRDASHAAIVHWNLTNRLGSYECPFRMSEDNDSLSSRTLA